MVDYRIKRKYENLEKQIFSGVGEFAIPELEPTQFVGNCEFIPFNYALTTKSYKNKGVHFFIDDYQFNRIWTYPERYIDVLSKFTYVMAPDFSIYTDFPKAIQIYNHYRKHWLGRYLQERGIKVIPTIAWGNEDSFDWCFDGEPAGSCVAVSSVGCAGGTSEQLFIVGYREMMMRLNPQSVIIYGSIFPGCEGNIVQVPPFHKKFDRKGSDNGRAGK